MFNLVLIYQMIYLERDQTGEDSVRKVPDTGLLTFFKYYIYLAISMALWKIYFH